MFSASMLCAMDALTKRPFLFKMLSLGCSPRTHQMLPSCVNEKKSSIASTAVAAAPSTNFWNENIIFTPLPHLTFQAELSKTISTKRCMDAFDEIGSFPFRGSVWLISE